MEQYHFIVKDAKSSSLSKGDEEEAYRIRSHAQTRRRHGERSTASTIPSERSRSRQPNSNNQEAISREHSEIREGNSTTVDFPFSSSGATIIQSHWNHYFRRAASGEELRHPNIVSISVQPAGNSIDPFNSTSMLHHPSAYQLMQFLESDFNSANFRAEALGRPSTIISQTEGFRHQAAYSERMRNALQNEMLMLSILAYASGAIGWRYGVRFKDLPPEYFIQRTYQKIRERLQQSKEVDEVLLWSMYGLAAAEMWVFNFDAAATHMRAVQVLISQAGGIKKLSHLIMESIILGGKFLAFFTMSAPIPTTDFEPGCWPEGWPYSSVSFTFLPPELQELGTGFFAAENAPVIDDWYQKILVDLIACVQISHHASARAGQSPEPERERWLYLKVQALNYHLLAQTELVGIQEALRIATLVWILSITHYTGARLTSLLLLPKLQAALEMVKLKEPSSSQLFPSLHFWMSSIGALVSLSAAKKIPTGSLGPKSVPYNRQFNFFSLHMAQKARQLRLEPTFDIYRSFLLKYLYMDVNGGAEGVELKSLVETVSGIDQDSLQDSPQDSLQDVTL